MERRLYYKDLPGYEEATEYQKKYIGKNTYYNLEQIKNEPMCQEVADFIRYRAEKMKIAAFYGEHRYYTQICRFLNERANSIKSLKEKAQEEWMKNLKLWMLKEGIPLTYPVKCAYGTLSFSRSRLLGYMDQLLKFTFPEDTIPEKEKDIWKLNKLDIVIRRNPIKNFATVNFTRIYQTEIREEVKEGIYLNLQMEALSCVQRELTAVRRLSGFLKNHYPSIQSLQAIDRKILEEYLIYLRTEKTTTKHYHSELNRLRGLLECIGKIFNYENLEGLFLTRDIPSTPRAKFKVYSDAELKRLNAHIANLNEQFARVMIIHQLLGTRISDTLTLQTDCLYEKDGELFIRIRQMKTHMYEKPISIELGELITKAIGYTKERYGKTKWIFVNDRNPDCPLQYGTIQYQVVRMIRTENIRDDQGEFFGFGTHMYRHTYGTKLTEMHLDDWTIARLLGQKSVKNTRYYRKMSNQTLAEETREARRKLSEMILANLNGWEDEYGKIRENGSFE